METVNEVERILDPEKPVVEEDSVDAVKEGPADEAKDQEPEDKVMSMVLNALISAVKDRCYSN